MLPYMYLLAAAQHVAHCGSVATSAPTPSLRLYMVKTYICKCGHGGEQGWHAAGYSVMFSIFTKNKDM